LYTKHIQENLSYKIILKREIMKITKIKMGKKPAYLIDITTKEAERIIASLSKQLCIELPGNADGEFFTIKEEFLKLAITDFEDREQKIIDKFKHTQEFKEWEDHLKLIQNKDGWFYQKKTSKKTTKST
jgi:hypothetical protein